MDSGSQRTRCLTPRKRDLKSGTVLSSGVSSCRGLVEVERFVCMFVQQPAPTAMSAVTATPPKPQRMFHTTPYNVKCASISQHIDNVMVVFPRTDPLSRVLFTALTFTPPIVIPLVERDLVGFSTVDIDDYLECFLERCLQPGKAVSQSKGDGAPQLRQ